MIEMEKNKPTASPVLHSSFISKEKTPSPIQVPGEPKIVDTFKMVHDQITEQAAPIALRREARARSKVKSFADDEDEEYSSGAELSRLPVKRQRNNTDDDQFSVNLETVGSPIAGRKCQHCNATETPQWRRGPSGKRTLCNACGVKWASGRLHVPAIHSSPLFFSMSETETNQSSDHGSGIDEEIEVGTTAWKLQLEVARLKSKLRETEKSQKKLEKLLVEGHASDRKQDRCYRKILSGAKKSQPRYYSSKQSRNIDDLFHKYADEYDGDLADDEGTINVRFGDSSERDRQLERTIIVNFVQTVQNNLRM